MKKYGHTRKKLYLLSFLLGSSLVAMLWLYSISFLPIGRVNDSFIYSYQLREYQKSEKYNQMRDVIDMQIRKQAESAYEDSKKRGESFDIYLERYRKTSTALIY